MKLPTGKLKVLDYRFAGIKNGIFESILKGKTDMPIDISKIESHQIFYLS